MTNTLCGRRSAATAALVCASALGVLACGSSPSSSPTVPATASGATSGSAPGSATGAASSSANGSGKRRLDIPPGRSTPEAVAAAVRCIRDHGIPGYQDPVITPDGAVYTDERSFQAAPESTASAVVRSCRASMVRAHLDPYNEPPAPPALVQAGVKTAQCARAHGLPNMHDPNAQSPYTPGHGFGHSADEITGGKDSPGFKAFRVACREAIDAELKASTLASLGGHG
ncbi:MAG: hypothetical protein JWN32_4277 [Solirubrobacterales bacterium]|jgi:hypothetical protein|nr:hypothetical protein [Solirubrobacterales bacterium]